MRVSVLDDAVTEGDEIVTLTATSANALVTNGTDGDSATGTITDDRGGDNPDRDEDTTANLVVTGGATAVEADGNYLTYSVQLDQPVGDDVTAVLSLGSDAANEATFGSDYSNLEYQNAAGEWVAVGANGEITVPADGSPVQVRVSVLDDAVTEGDEIVTLTATSANALVTNGTDGDSATGTITDDRGGDNPDRDEDTTANLVVTGGATAVEADGNYLTYSVQLDQPVGDDVTAVLSLGSDAANEATFGSDYSNLEYQKRRR